MTRELWARLNPLFLAAIEKPGNERDTFIAEACGEDEELRRELAALVEAHAQQDATNDNVALNIRSLIGRAQAKFSPSDIVLGRFKIVRRLGSGGMGDVYEALDLELAQTVALKSVRPEIAGNPGVVSRFKKEVQLARRLDGPNICRIHELFLIPGDGVTSAGAFLTMEFLDGVTLAETLQQAGPIPWREARAIAVDMCAGLSAMHEAGIIHRDLKSRNIMLANRGGAQRAVLMDFGLARELSIPSASAETTLTGPGAFIGTPEYMAPEQFEGKEVSPATDVYAMGVVLYEMLTGKHPFAAPNALRGAVLRSKRLDPPSTIQKGVPHRWDLVISKCLEYDPKRRFASTKEIEREIRIRPILFRLRRTSLAFGVGAIGLLLIFFSLLFIPAIADRARGILFSSHEKHIAVLPLDMVGESKESQALGDGLMDSLAGKISDLDTSNPSVWVIPASEVRERKVHDPSSALREFGATIVIKGSFERADRSVRLKLNIIDPKKMRQIGFVDVENQSDDLADLQDEAITRLGHLMGIPIKKDEGTYGGANVAQGAAYQHYLIALGYMQRFDQPGNLDLAIQALRNAVKIDDQFALAFARLGRAYILKFRLDSNSEWLDQAQLFCKRAAELDGRVPSTYITLADIHELTGQHGLAIQEFQRAIALDPRDPDAFSGIAKSYQNAGNIAEAEASYRKAAALRPEDWNGYNNLGNFYDEIGRFPDAIREFIQALQLTPNNSAVLVDLGIAYLDSGDPKTMALAEDALKKSISINPTYQAYANLANLYGIQRRFADSAAASQKALQMNDEDYNVWNNLTDAYEALGQRQQASASRNRAIALAEKAVQLNSQDADARATLAALFAGAGEPDKAVVSLRASLLLAPNSPSVLAEVADAYESLGSRRQAITYLKRALKFGLARDQLNGDPLLSTIAADPDFNQNPVDGPSRP